MFTWSALARGIIERPNAKQPASSTVFLIMLIILFSFGRLFVRAMLDRYLISAATATKTCCLVRVRTLLRLFRPSCRPLYARWQVQSLYLRTRKSDESAETSKTFCPWPLPE